MPGAAAPQCRVCNLFVTDIYVRSEVAISLQRQVEIVQTNIGMVYDDDQLHTGKEAGRIGNLFACGKPSVLAKVSKIEVDDQDIDIV